MKGWDYVGLKVKNNCIEPIRFAIHAMTGGEGEAPGFCNNRVTVPGSWCTRAWFDVGVGEETDKMMGTENHIIYYYAEMLNYDYVWSGDSCWLLDGGDCTEGSTDCYCFRQASEFACTLCLPFCAIPGHR